MAGLCYWPWFRYSHALWQKVMADITQPHVSLHSLAMIARELVGAGYLQSSLVVAACLVCLIRMPPQRFGRLFWICVITSSIAAPIILDFYFGYFLASRQWLFSLPGLAFLASQSSLECGTD